MPKRLTTTPPLYVKKHKNEWSKRIILYLFTFFLLLNIFGYLFYYDDMSGPFIDPSSIFIKQCDMRSKSKDHLTPVDMEFNITTPYDDDDDDVDFEDDDIIDSINIANEIDEKHDERINRKYCGKSSCKFLFAYYQPEQETKANMHFRSFVNLAQALDRVMVLTNVGNSRINSCQNFTFGFYYNEKALQSMFPKVKFISQKDFQNWMRERNQKPNTEHAYILPGKEEISTMELVKPYPDILRTKHCLDRFDFKLDDKTNFKLFNTPIEFSKDLEKYQGFADFLVNNLRTDADVLLTSHFVFHSLFPNVSSPVPYSNHYHEEAAKITNRIKPYVAIHWRMERADINKLPECADALVKKIQQLKDSNNIQNVYLATDYPTGGGNKTQSQTFHLLTENHHEAIRLLNSTFNIHTWVSSKIFSNLRNDETFEKEFLGAGMPGIVDKLVCIEADYFLATPEGCGRARSTYTTMIINERDKALQLGDKPQLKNVVERWIEPIEDGKFTF